jgi:hypothetical protein
MNRESEAVSANGQNSEGAFPDNKTLFTAYKDERSKYLHALRTRTYAKNKIISFPEVNRVLGWYKIRKAERDELLYGLQQDGYLKIVPYHGVILEEGQS